MPVALITGGNRGIGLELCKRLAQDGYSVLMGVRERWLGLVLPGGIIRPLVIDVADEDSIVNAAHQIVRLDLLINNAAQPDWTESGHHGALTIPADLWLYLYRVNVLGPLLVTRHFLPLMPRGSRVVNVVSGVGEFTGPRVHEDFQVAYAASKSALLMTTFKLAEALRPFGVACNAACPGWCRTRMGGEEAPRSAVEGAESVLKAAFLGQAEAPTGGYYRDGVEIKL